MKTHEVRMYSREIEGAMALVFVDHTGNERVVAQFGAELPAPEPSRPAERRPWSLEQLLERASDPEPAALAPEPTPIAASAPETAEPLDDAARRRLAKGAIRKAVAAASQNSHDLQMRYELALQAHNGNVEALEMMMPEATLKGVGAKELAEQIIVERRARERRMMQVYAAQERAFKALETAAGDNIAQIGQQAVVEIRGPDDVPVPSSAG